MKDINAERIEKMTDLLNEALEPSEILILDESHLHAGHVGAQTGKGHFALTIKSGLFSGVLPLKRHQMVYSALGDMMETEIHALSISAS